ncbi:MAG: efflux RND transporter periplasmic adaptor subunit [Chloroflexi bacterium]|nr:efflux RND transporter periplasmic adaptor subunit [Chloroflexota bacterium]MBU1750482.1 efflux RND transporter periplasmic adaptor subunit [Chloroflexota bacterium]MBU1878013.1 efflux RND transporter periplasmic adaptor subunit [Chloroflexota bacterium]
MLRRILLIILLLFIVAVIVAAWWYLNQPVPPQTAAVIRGDIVAAVETSGNVAARQQIRLAFKYGGRLSRIVSVGETVHQGQIVAELDPGRLSYDVQQAQLNLDAAELRLAEAQYRLDHLSAPQLTVAQINLERATIALQGAQQEYDRVAWNAELANAAGRTLQFATLDYQSAEANYKLAQSSITADRQSLAVLEKQIESARLSVTTAKLELGEMRLATPLDGTVLVRGYRPGEIVPGGVDCLVVADTSALEIRASVDEIDIGAVAVGQSVHITLDAFPTEPLTGTVREIAPLAQPQGGSTALEVRIDLDPGDVPVRVGMSAGLKVQVERRTGVLLVPSRAIQTAGASKVVDVLRDGRVQRVEVVVGLNDGVYTEIRQGLNQGDAVVIP